MERYGRFSYWLETSGDDLSPRDGLPGSIDVDIAILGAGFTGLWTAYYLQQRDPSLSIAVIEREIAGFGASGRNGGWCSSGFSVSLPVLAERFGDASARAVQLAMFEAVDEVGRVLEVEGIDAHYQKSGSLRLARGRHQLPLIEQSYAAVERLGLGDRYRLLSADQTAERVRVSDVHGALLNPQCAVIHPGRLVRGLARVVERRGAVIYEQTDVLDYIDGRFPRLLTSRGDVNARTLVLAGEAYLAQQPRLRRQLIPIYSLIVLTEPLSEEQWAEIGWQDRECVSSMRSSVDYLSKTVDGRVVFGGRGAPYRFGSAIGDELDRHEPTHAMLRRMTEEWFPVARGVRFTHAWGGPLGVPRDWMPTMSYDRSTGVATARGYTGQGVATANLSGRVLADLITGVDSELTRLPMVGHQSPDWEPEPLRWLGVRYVQRGYVRLDDEAESFGRPPSGRTLVERLGRH